MYNSETGKNIFHITCALSINSLISAVWQLAEKIFKEDAKQYFLRKSTSPYDPDDDAISIFFKQISNDNTRNLLQISPASELREKTNLDIIISKDLNDNDNFKKSSIFLVFEIMKTLKLTDDELLRIFNIYFDYISKFDVLFLKLNLYLTSDFLTIDSPLVFNVLSHIYKTSETLILQYSSDENVKKFLNYLKSKSSTANYEIIVKNIFANFIQGYKRDLFYGIAIYNDENRFISKSLVLYIELRNVCEYHSENLKNFFKTFPNFFHLFENRVYNVDGLNAFLKLIFQILDEEHLTLLLLNKAFDGVNIINKVIVVFKSDYQVHDRTRILLSLLESKYSEKSKLYSIVEQSDILKTSTLSAQNFPLIYEFCQNKFENSEIEALLLPFEDRPNPCLAHMNVVNTIMNLYLETFDNQKWKKFFFKTDQNGETVIHELLKDNLIENAVKLIEIANDKLNEDFEALMNLKDINGNSIASLRDQKCQN